MKLILALIVVLPTAFAAFGVVRSGNNFVVDSGAGLVTTINANNGDITSLNYNGKQLQDQSKFTHLSSGLGSASVTTLGEQQHRCNHYPNQHDYAFQVLFEHINNQGGDQQELYWYMNSGHYQTESWRTGFFGPYALVITNGQAPSPDLDVSFFEDLNLQGYVRASQRGTVTGSFSGVLPGQPVVIGFKNAAAQYWVEASGSGSGSFTRNMMKPGTYDVTLFQGELEAGAGRVTVNAGQTTAINLSSNLSRPNVIWSIGTPDGTPRGFLNADKIEIMHPHAVPTYSSTLQVNNPTRVQWNANSSQIGARTLRIRTTGAFAGGRPQIYVNGRWTSHAPPEGKGSVGFVTRGTWRRDNQVYAVIQMTSTYHLASW
ncbi:rhamnogalacturonase B [Coprinopsis cinerea okayama7|uniref:rhamnogalacturonan endolyase n=1 Tax=Coprinopsis cinerea (strain Okayama-7 / 130 / ATCC MYA-4618 / FGSC 9003) TaxID=240176 RepID=A8NRT4_COPC7|nr:rhamnogalacturonase B [Coprinopsis cinerea okayama7\|eukprot:XP_001835849.2 rhamnogalacturonase B [Coprinopsis cinerea okayama7\